VNGVFLAIAGVIWAVAAYAFVRVVITWVGLMAMAPASQRIPAAFEIGFWNFAAAERRLGAQAVPLIERYRRGFYLFFACFVPFVVLTAVAIFVGNAPER
jgi:hypothetical protein